MKLVKDLEKNISKINGQESPKFNMTNENEFEVKI